jgi:opacity protein-like surface antigen
MYPTTTPILRGPPPIYTFPIHVKWGLIMRRASIALFAAVSTVAYAQIASAADMPVKAPGYKAPVVAPLYNWTGPYIGIAGGYGWGHSNQTDPGIIINDDGSYGVNGGLLGGTLGYNWQQGTWVFGVEGDYSWADISGSSNTCGPHPPCNSTSLRYQA